MMRRGAWMLLAVVAAWAATARAAEPASDPFYQGLKARGLDKLAEQYIRIRGVEPPPVIPTVPPGQAEAAAKAEVQAAQKAPTADRDPFFERALALYRRAIADAEETYARTAGGKWDERAAARLKVLELRRDLADMFFTIPDNWLQPYLRVLEVSDRQVGNRERAAELLKIALGELETLLQGAAQWLSEIDRDPDRVKYVNAQYVRGLQNLRRTAEFNAAWVTYFYGWALPKDYTPPAGERTRKELLNDAITRLMQFADLPASVTAKYYAHLIIGQAQRELGQYEQALDSYARADRNEAPKELRIQAAYETALVRLRQQRYKQARQTIDQTRQLFGKAEVERTIHGLAMPLIEAEALIREGQQTNSDELKEKGTAILTALLGSPPPWPPIAQMRMLALTGGAAAKPEELDPPLLWMQASEALNRAQESKKPEDFERAGQLYAAYAKKVGPEHENYAMALYCQAAVEWQLGRKPAAGAFFRQVAEKFPRFKEAASAAQYAVSVMAEQYEASKTDENLQTYEETLRWFTQRWAKEDPTQLYNLGVILFRGKKYMEAAKAFAQVPRTSERYPDARYWVPLCHLEEFREQVLPAKDRSVILSRAPSVVNLLTDFAEYAVETQIADEAKKQELLGWAQGAYVNSAALYLDPDVDLPSDALRVLDQMESKLRIDDDMRGRVMKFRIDALQKLRRLDEARRVLDDFLALMKKQGKEQEIGGVLAGLFQATLDEVRGLLKRDKRTAAERVEAAVNLSRQLIEWLEANGGPDKTAQVLGIRYDVAELYLAVERCNEALGIYQEIGGTKPWEPPAGEALKVDCCFGMGLAYECLAAKAADQAERRKHLEPALEIWRVLRRVVGDERGTPPARIWELEYHMYNCQYQLGQVQEVREALKALQVLRKPDPLGGADPEMQMKFRDLLSRVGGG